MIPRFMKCWCQSALPLILLSCGFTKEPKNQNLRVIAGNNFQELDKVSKHYVSNDKKLKAYNFLLNHLDNQFCVLSCFLAGKDTIWLTYDACNDTALLLQLANSSGHEFNSPGVTTRDAAVLNAAFLVNNIDQAFLAYNNYQWAKTTSFDTFCKYVLPYKVRDENLDQWRPFFYRRLKTRLDSLNHTLNPTTSQVFRIIEQDISQWLDFNAAASGSSGSHGIVQLMITHQGDCFDFANLYVYGLRTFGIPATVDYVPLWGSQNGSHAEVVFQDARQRLSTLDSGRLSRSAKVYRAVYETVTDEHMKALKVLTLLHQYSNGYRDVTDEHNVTSDLTYVAPYDAKKATSVICTFNYGRWMPVFVGEASNSKKVVFSKMGRDIVYRFAILNENQPNFTSPPFLLDVQGEMRFPEVSKEHLISLSAQKINHGDLSWIKKGADYELYYYDKNDWEFHQRKRAERDSLIIFEGVPSNAFYRVIPNNNSYLSRIFLYQNGLQAWY